MLINYISLGLFLAGMCVALALFVQRDRILGRLREEHPEIAPQVGASEKFALFSPKRGNKYLRFVSEKEYKSLHDEPLEAMISTERRLQLLLYWLIAIIFALWLTRGALGNLD